MQTNKQVCIIRDTDTEQRVLADYMRLREVSRMASSRDIRDLLDTRYQYRGKREYDEDDLEELINEVYKLSGSGEAIYDMAYNYLSEKEDGITLSVGMLNRLQASIAGREADEQICFNDSASWAKGTAVLMREQIKASETPLCALLLLEEYLDRLGTAILQAASAKLQYEEREKRGYFAEEMSYYYSEEEIGELFDGRL